MYIYVYCLNVKNKILSNTCIINTVHFGVFLWRKDPDPGDPKRPDPDPDLDPQHCFKVNF